MASKKQLTADKLMKFLQSIQKSGVDLKKVEINFRTNRNSDVVPIRVVEEDLFDSKTNSILESIVFIKDPKEL